MGRNDNSGQKLAKTEITKITIPFVLHSFLNFLFIYLFIDIFHPSLPTFPINAHI